MVSMGFVCISNPSKWFSNKGLRLCFPCFRSKSSALLTPSPPAVPPPTLHNTTREEDLQEVFCQFDSDRDGKISCEELSAYFTSMGDNVSKNDVLRVIKEFDDNGDDLLEFKEFIKLMDGGNEGDDDIRRAFEMYEVDKGCGCITPMGLQQMLGRLGDTKSYQECKAMIGVFDLDGNGVLDFHEFQHMIRGEQYRNNKET